MSIFAENRPYLTGRHAALAALLDSVESHGDIAVEDARSGEPTARLRVNDAPGPYLHSRVDPRTEARRAAAAVSDAAGYVAVWGPGLFYEVEFLLERPALAFLLVLEPRPAFLRAALERRHLESVLSDPRVRILTGAEAGPGEAARAVSETYLPAVHGALHIEGTRPRAVESRETLSAVGAAARGQLADLAVQQRFGRRWFSNAVRNLATLPPAAVDFPRAATMIVAAAGPSLERQLAELDTRVPIISTDTAAPVLLQRGVRPASVVSLDCQQVSYHHLLCGGSGLRSVPLVADLSSPPTVLRHAVAGVLATTAYPLARLLHGRFPELPIIDGGGGNVTQAALSLAVTLGARRVHILGADLAYPDGAPYARDSYVYPYFRSSETRLRPAQSRLFELVLADPRTVSAEEAGRRVYTPPTLSRYRRKLQEHIAGIDARVTFGAPRARPLVGGGPGGEGRGGVDGGGGGVRITVPPVPARVAWLREYAEAVTALSVPSAAAGAPFADCGDECRGLWYSVLPAAAAFTGNELDVRRTPAVLDAALQWTTGRLSRILTETG
ncbi:MAG: 6-hydroxymethylpterin diphosphokinase MptE-like protein [Spirochaetaceae bacterium]